MEQVDVLELMQVPLPMDNPGGRLPEMTLHVQFGDPPRAVTVPV